MLRMSLLAAVAVVSLVAAQDRRAAIVITDVRLDDKVAVNYVSSAGKYSSVTAVITCVADADRAHGDLRDFLVKTYRNGNSPVRIMRVPNPRSEAVRYEKFFIGNATETSTFLDRIDQLFDSPTVVDIFQIAPTPMDNIVRLIKAKNVHVGLYHLSFGYCSSQYDSCGIPDPNAQKVFLDSIGDEIRRQHPNAVVVFCSNKQSFNPPGSGSYQPYAAMKDLLPEDHLEAELKEPFLADRLLEAKEALEYCNVSTTTPLFPNIPGRNVDTTADVLHQLVLEVRKNENKSMSRELRQHFRTYLDEALPELNRCMHAGSSVVWQRCDNTLVKRLEEHVLPVFQDDAQMQILISDGNQVAAVIDAKHQNWTNLKGMEFVYNHKDKVYEFAEAPGAADKMLCDASPTRCLELLRPTLLSQ
ncbi:hypothetical protein PBRA_005624 [Plasmodiophora brassicae]|uniref:Uncharacterized protein n=1 Tax=Plasmodiophora brassicae TaxID=37360 RepID=A0A0G4IP99_PLABS|nr:hypothetical protein PBRA_005624 [Plasmodiophora brassicae]